MPLRTVEDWAGAYVRSTDLGWKVAPPPVPEAWAVPARPLAIGRPGRPAELAITHDKPRSVKLGALRAPEARAKLCHKFWHHELQAAELMCWAVLRFADADPAFRRGLVRIALDEVRHMELYQGHIERLGYRLGDFRVRDWFWERVPTCETPAQFVALLGMGFEAANLEHTPRFASWFRAVGDERGAEIQDRVGSEEVGHVRFAVHWFRRWTGADDFDAWTRHLPAPLSPLLMRGKTINRQARLQAGMNARFVDCLEAWRP